MAYGFEHQTRLEVGLSIRVDPRVVVASQILQLSGGALDAAIESELSENPALERSEGAEPISQHDVLRIVAPAELKPWTDSWESSRSLPAETDDTWVEMAAAQNSLIDHLSACLINALKPKYHPIAAYVIGSLDERGYLTTPDEEIALDCNASMEDVALVIKALQGCEPAGIGARDVSECLLLQLNANDPTSRLAKRIVSEFMDDLTARRSDRIARKLQTKPAEVEKAIQKILSLTPYPVSGYAGLGTCLASRSEGVYPDLIIRRTEVGWHVEATGADASVLRVDGYYSKRLNELKNEAKPKTVEPKGLEAKDGSDARDEVRHLATFVQRAEDFIDGIKNRKQTLERIGKFLVEIQPGFLSTADYSFLRPLTRSEVAKRLCLHESTVSRATNGKFVQLPDGETVSFDVFFKPALRIQKMIEEILASENPGNPLSDEQIAAILAERGVSVARRTVNKYRDRRKLLSSRKRRAA